MTIDALLKGIEVEFRKNPYKIWEYLQEGDLVVTKSLKNRYIVGVKKYLPRKRRIEIEFLYSLKTDRFFVNLGTEESPDLVERWPTSQEVARLRNNVDYLTFMANKGNE